MATKTDELLEQITNKIIAQIETGAGKWSKPWTSVLVEGGLGINAKTNAAYQGFNQIILMATAAEMDYVNPLWATYKQWNELGGQVQKGEKGTMLVKWGFNYRCQGCDYKGKVSCPKEGHISSTVWWASPFIVFNVAQTDYPYEKPEPLPEPERHAAAERVIEESGADITYRPSNGAYYSPLADQITLPERSQFSTPEGFYGTALHELGHWTGHESRLNRQQRNRFGDNAYAAEELIAELTAAFIAVKVGITPEPHIDHASYLKSWLTVLKADPRNLYVTARDAQAAADFLLKTEKVYEGEREKEKVAA